MTATSVCSMPIAGIQTGPAAWAAAISGRVRFAPIANRTLRSMQAWARSAAK